MKINIAMIVKNEEVCLAKCLESVKGLGDIFIVDTGSNDKTLEIARRFTEKISFYKWDNNFSNARNYGLKQIPKNTWVFQIDADEYIESSEIYKIKYAASHAKKKAILVKIIHDETGGQHVFPRLFKSELRFLDPVHNRLNNKDYQSSTITIHHSPSVTHNKDPKRSLRILENIKNPSTRETYLLGREYLNFKKYKKSIEILAQYIKKAKPDQQAAEAMVMLSISHFMIKDNHMAKLWCLEALVLNPEYKEALIRLAMYCNPPHMQSWLKYARSAQNTGITNIEGRQSERIEEFQKISELAISGKPFDNVINGRDKLKK